MKKLITTLGLIACVGVFSDPLIKKESSSVWQDVVDAKQTQSKRITSEDTDLKRRLLILDEQDLKRQLTESFSQEISLPLPKGGFVRVRVIDSPIFSTDLAESHPDIKTWRIVGVDDPSITGRIDFTPQGFHGMLVLGDGDTVYIDPDKKSNNNLYYSLGKQENHSHFKTDFDCQVHDSHALFSNSEEKRVYAKKLAQTPAPNLITYRLALAGTAEYTATQGGTKASAYASMVTTINRVNQIYQRDLGIRLELVSGEQLIYTNASTDPYTDNDRFKLVDENMANLLSNFGENNYDLGHVFSKGASGGLAYVGVACLGTVNSPGGIIHGVKGGGTTGIPNPKGETFSIDFVAHEIGHQLGADHTFNGTGGSCGNGRNPETAVEAGSGSTIMGYSGLCGSDDLQYETDAMFHQVSMNQISAYTRNDHGSDCGVRTSTGNQNPVANAGEDIRVPRLTPFLLAGSATGGTTYAWDQMDAGSASHVDVDLGNNAIIRSELPSANPNRFIPRLSDLFANTTTIGEKLPSASRSLNFSFVVRDGNGGVSNDYKTVSVVDSGAGKFRVTSQFINRTYSLGQTVDIKWYVAGTQNAPISCNTVDIKLIRQSGVENMLLENTANDGTETIIIPLQTPEMTDARIMVACNTQSFFQISSGEITIKQGTVDKIAPVITIIGSSSVEIAKAGQYSDAGATANDNVDGNVTVTTSGAVNTAVAGVYTITYTAIDAAGNTSTAIRTVTVAAAVDTIPPVITLIGANRITITQNTSYIDQGATTTDNVDTIVSVSISGSVDVSTLGSYTIIYTAKDKAENTATQERIVTVVAKSSSIDTTPPVITLIGDATVTLEEGKSFTDLDSKALDNNDGVVSVVVSGAVDVNNAGTYVLTYTATDKAGNISTVTRTVIITKKDDNGSKSNEKSGGGSIGFILLPLLAIVGIRRKALILKK